MQRIIVRVPNWIGDAVLSTPALAFLRKIYPDAHIAILTKEWAKDVFKANPSIDEIMTLNKSLLRASMEVRQKRFDSGLLFPDSFSSALLFFIAGIPQRMGYPTDGRYLLLNRRIRRSRDFKKEHQVMYFLRLVQALGHKSICFESSSDINLVWMVTDEERKRTDTILKEVGLFSDRDVLVGINPGAAFGPAKRWFTDRYAKLADELVKRYNVKVIIFGGPQDCDITGEVASLMKSSSINLAGKITLRELAAIIARCNVFITNDTGPMHIAAAVGTKVVAIFGSTDPVRTSPWGEGHIIVKKEVECSPCLKPFCLRNDYKCLDMITVEDVLGLIEEKGILKQ